MAVLLFVELRKKFSKIFMVHGDKTYVQPIYYNGVLESGSVKIDRFNGVKKAAETFPEDFQWSEKYRRTANLVSTLKNLFLIKIFMNFSNLFWIVKKPYQSA